MGQYLIMLYEDEASWAAVGEHEAGEILAAHGRFAAAHGDVLRGGGWLHPTATATTVRSPGGGGSQDRGGFAAGEDALVTDGPFVETKEALGGYYLVEVPDLDTAMAVAREVPAPFGGVEVRPLRDM
jgi:hypothetical protein